MHDWNSIKTEFISTNVSAGELGRRYGVDRRTVERHARDGGWRQLRALYAGKLCDAALDSIGEHDAGHLSKLFCATSKAVDVAVAALEDEQQFKRYLVNDEAETQEKVFAKVDTKALKNLTGALKDLTGLMRDFYNLPTPVDAERIRLAAERLELEKERAASDGDSADVFTVRFENTGGAER